MSIPIPIFSPIDGPNGLTKEKTPRHQFSFGIELEFSIAALDHAHHDPTPHLGGEIRLLPPNRYGLLFEKKFEAGIIVRADVANHLNNSFKHITYTPVSLEGKEHTTEFWASSDDGMERSNSVPSRRRESEVEKPLIEWSVEQDPSIHDPNDFSLLPHSISKNFEFSNVEVVSPAFIYIDEVVKHIRHVIRSIVKRYRVWMDNSCGFHVHFGQGVHGFEGKHLRNLMAILWTFEEQFYALVDEGRSEGNGKDYARKLVDGSRLAERVRLDPETKVVRSEKEVRRYGLEMLFSEPETEVVHLMCGEDDELADTRLGFNLLNLDSGQPFQSETKKTIEIRIHEGTMDPEAVGQWIHLWARFLDFAESVNEDTLKAWLLDKVDMNIEEYSPWELLLALKAPESARYYAQKKIDKLGKDVDNHKMGVRAKEAIALIKSLYKTGP